MEKTYREQENQNGIIGCDCVHACHCVCRGGGGGEEGGKGKTRIRRRNSTLPPISVLGSRGLALPAVRTGAYSAEPQAAR